MKKSHTKIILAFTLAAFTQSTFAFTTLPCFRYWASAEYLSWWSSDSSISVPLATQNVPGSLAIINQPGTEIIIGQNSSQNQFNFGNTGGARIIIGGWIDDAYRFGLEASGFALTPKTARFTASSSATNSVDVPFFSVLTSSENVLVGGRPNTVTDKDTFQPSSLEINTLYRIPPCYLPCFYRFPVVVTAGLRFVNVDEKLELTDAILDTPSLPPGSVLNVEDIFNARNHFYGIQFGARTNAQYRDFTFEGLAEIAFGINYQRLDINGYTSTNSGALIQYIGLFAEPTNSGEFTNNEFSIVPALQLKLSYNFHSFARPFIAYDVIYMSNVLRSAKQVDRNINQSQNPLLGGTGILTGSAQPTPQFRQSNLWLQGVSIGVDFG